MAKRRSEEARVLAYFTEAPVEKAELMLGLVKEAVRKRMPKPSARLAQRTRVGKATQTVAVDTSMDIGKVVERADRTERAQ